MTKSIRIKKISFRNGPIKGTMAASEEGNVGMFCDYSTHTRRSFNGVRITVTSNVFFCGVPKKDRNK